jgi:putative SOS response-associated peptidase YedK
VRYDAKAGERSLDVMRWGLPYWATDIKIGFSTFNGRARGVEALRRRRRLVPLDSFYQWKKTGAGKQPYAMALADWRLMALASLWETWRSPAGERVRSFTIITTTLNELRARLYNRMPVFIEPVVWLEAGY